MHLEGLESEHILVGSMGPYSRYLPDVSGGNNGGFSGRDLGVMDYGLGIRTYLDATMVAELNRHQTGKDISGCWKSSY